MRIDKRLRHQLETHWTRYCRARCNIGLKYNIYHSRGGHDRNYTGTTIKLVECTHHFQQQLEKELRSQWDLLC